MRSKLFLTLLICYTVYWKASFGVDGVDKYYFLTGLKF